MGDFRIRISGSHFAKCEGILSFCEALSQRKNKNTKLSISFLVPKFHLVTIIFKQNNFLQKHLISWQNPILQPPRQTNFHTVYLASFIFLSHSVLYNCQITFKCSSVKQLFQNYFYRCFFIKGSTGSHLNGANFNRKMLFCYAMLPLKLNVPLSHIEAKKTLLPMVS